MKCRPKPASILLPPRSAGNVYGYVVGHGSGHEDMCGRMLCGVSRAQCALLGDAGGETSAAAPRVGASPSPRRGNSQVRRCPECGGEPKPETR